VTVKRWKGHPSYRWRAHYVANGKKQARGFKTKKEAENWAEEREAESLAEGADRTLTERERSAVIETRGRLAELGVELRTAVELAIEQYELARKSCTVSELVDRVIAERERAGLSDRYIRDMRSRLGRFREDFGERAIATITRDEIADWLHALDRAPRTKNNFRRILVVMFSDAVESGYLVDNPAVKVKQVKVVESEVGVLTPKEMKDLLEAADEAIVPAIAIGGFAGVRRSELGNLDWEDVDHTQKLIRIRSGNAKSSRNRLIPISPNLEAWLKPFAKTAGRIWPHNGDRLLSCAHRGAGLGKPGSETAAEKKAGIELHRDWPDNALRHSFASYWLAEHKNAEELALHMGHRGTAMIFSNYRAVVTPQAAAEYWAIFPREAENVIEMAG